MAKKSKKSAPPPSSSDSSSSEYDSESSSDSSGSGSESDSETSDAYTDTYDYDSEYETESSSSEEEESGDDNAESKDADKTQVKTDKTPENATASRKHSLVKVRRKSMIKPKIQRRRSSVTTKSASDKTTKPTAAEAGTTSSTDDTTQLEAELKAVAESVADEVKDQTETSEPQQQPKLETVPEKEEEEDEKMSQEEPQSPGQNRLIKRPQAVLSAGKQRILSTPVRSSPVQKSPNSRKSAAAAAANKQIADIEAEMKLVTKRLRPGVGAINDAFQAMQTLAKQATNQQLGVEARIQVFGKFCAQVDQAHQACEKMARINSGSRQKKPAGSPRASPHKKVVQELSRRYTDSTTSHSPKQSPKQRPTPVAAVSFDQHKREMAGLQRQIVQLKAEVTSGLEKQKRLTREMARSQSTPQIAQPKHVVVTDNGEFDIDALQKELKVERKRASRFKDHFRKEKDRADHLQTNFDAQQQNDNDFEKRIRSLERNLETERTKNRRIVSDSRREKQTIDQVRQEVEEETDSLREQLELMENTTQTARREAERCRDQTDRSRNIAKLSQAKQKKLERTVDKQQATIDSLHKAHRDAQASTVFKKFEMTPLPRDEDFMTPSIAQLTGIAGATASPSKTNKATKPRHTSTTPTAAANNSTTKPKSAKRATTTRTATTPIDQRQTLSRISTLTGGSSSSKKLGRVSAARSNSGGISEADSPPSASKAKRHKQNLAAVKDMSQLIANLQAKIQEAAL